MIRVPLEVLVMRPKYKTVSVTKDYQIRVQKENFVSIDELNDLYCRENINDFAIIYHNDQSLTLISTYIVCPYCGYLHPIRCIYNPNQSQVNLIYDWSNQELTVVLSNEEEIETKFQSLGIHRFTCPYCHKESNDKHQKITISIKQEKYKLTIKHEINILHAKKHGSYLVDLNYIFNIPMYEQIEFNIYNGHSCIRYIGKDEIPLYLQDITNKPTILSNCFLKEWFNRFDIIKQTIKESMQNITKITLPVDLSNSLENYVFFSRFVGFDASFYLAMPYHKTTYMFHEHFTNLKRLHNQKTALEYLMSFTFSKNKSIRKLIFKNQGLLFYLHECAVLYNTINDVNIFCNILASKYIFDILMLFHCHPNTYIFFQDCCKVKGASVLSHKFSSTNFNRYDFQNYVINYCSLNHIEQKSEQKKWKKGFCFFNDMISTPYSLPLIHRLSSNVNATIRGYQFIALNNTAECYYAGEALQNCLQSWGDCDSGVVVVKQNSKFIASIEVFNHAIVQARSIGNQRISKYDGLKEVIIDWSKSNNIKCPFDKDE